MTEAELHILSSCFLETVQLFKPLLGQKSFNKSF